MISLNRHHRPGTRTQLKRSLLYASLAVTLVAASGCYENEPTSVTPFGVTAASEQPALVLSLSEESPFRITGGGSAPNGLPLVPGVTTTFSATGNATKLGKYEGDGTLTLGSLEISAAGEVSGTFQGTFVFVAANGDRLAVTYGDGLTGTLTGQLSADGLSVENVEFDAFFLPDPANSTGRFERVIGGGWRMIANADPLSLVGGAPGFTAPFDYTWSGVGTLEHANKAE